MISLVDSVSRLQHYSRCLFADSKISRIDTTFLQEDGFLLRGAGKAEGLKPDPGEGQGRNSDREGAFGPNRQIGVSGQDCNIICQRERKRRCGIGQCEERWRLHRYTKGSL